MTCDPANEIERSADHLVRIPLLDDSGIACVRVHPGDTIVLPFDISNSDISDDMALRARLLDGALVIEQDAGATIFLEGFEQAIHDLRPVTVSAVDGKPIDIAIWLATTDP